MSDIIFGQAALTNITAPNLNGGLANSLFSSKPNSGLTAVRVSDIILSPDHPLYENAGGENGIGVIQYNSLFSNENLTVSGSRSTFLAKPLSPNIKTYPIVNEIVYLLFLPSPTSQFHGTDESIPYYLYPLNVWNSQHHNALPNEIFYVTSSVNNEVVKNYQEAEGGYVRRVTDEPQSIPLGNFTEKTNIHPIQPYVGDVTLEGRWGQSIRFGSTLLGSNNTWSASGTNGDPITILRNGQPVSSSDEGWVHITENINTDLSSIWLTSTQQVPISVSSTNDYLSYTSSSVPTSPSEYNSQQIILNSGRLLFNTTQDSILLSSKKTINLNSVGSINFDTLDNIVLQGGKVYLGSKDAEQSVILGDDFIGDLNQLLGEMSFFLSILSNTIVTQGTTLGYAAVLAGNLSDNIKNYQAKFNESLSTEVKTI